MILRKQYKEFCGCYCKWGQLAHADEYLLFPDKIGPDLSIDEICLSNGEVYTLLTNKAAHGRKGTLVAMMANLFAIFAKVLVGAMPRLTGIPVPLYTLLTMVVPRLW